MDATETNVNVQPHAYTITNPCWRRTSQAPVCMFNEAALCCTKDEFYFVLILLFFFFFYNDNSENDHVFWVSRIIIICMLIFLDKFCKYC